MTDSGVRLTLVRPEEVGPAVESLQVLGWAPTPKEAYLNPHEVPLLRPGVATVVELHMSVGDRPLPAVLPTADVFGDSEELEIGGATVRAMSPSHRVLHTVLHAQVQDLNHAAGGIALRQLYTLATLVDSLEERIDWEAVRGAWSVGGC